MFVNFAVWCVYSQKHRLSNTLYIYHPPDNYKRLMNIYEVRRYGVVAFMIISVIVVAIFLYFSNSLVKDLSEQERARMQIWADATKQIVSMGEDDSEPSTADIDFLLSIIEENRNIPVMLTDDSGNIIMHRNFDLPEPIDSLNPLFISETNSVFLKRSSRNCATATTSSTSSFLPTTCNISTMRTQSCCARSATTPTSSCW